MSDRLWDAWRFVRGRRCAASSGRTARLWDSFGVGRSRTRGLLTRGAPRSRVRVASGREGPGHAWASGSHGDCGDTRFCWQILGALRPAQDSRVKVAHPDGHQLAESPVWRGFPPGGLPVTRTCAGHEDARVEADGGIRANAVTAVAGREQPDDVPSRSGCTLATVLAVGRQVDVAFNAERRAGRATQPDPNVGNTPVLEAAGALAADGSGPTS